MLEILVVMAVIYAIVMAAKRRGGGRRRMGKYLRGSIDEDLDLGTLGTKDVVLAAFDETVNERTLVSSIVLTWTLSNFTPIASAGPILVGVAHGDYTAAQIEEYIENTGSWNEGSMIGQEQANRKIRRVGIFDTPDAATDSSVLNDGKSIKTKLNWILNQGETLNQWAYNLGTAALATTDPRVHMAGHANLWPR